MDKVLHYPLLKKRATSSLAQQDEREDSRRARKENIRNKGRKEGGLDQGKIRGTLTRGIHLFVFLSKVLLFFVTFFVVVDLGRGQGGSAASPGFKGWAVSKASTRSRLIRNRRRGSQVASSTG
jgi:hypothetical protein